MSVIGIDFGNESCYVAAAKAGGIETLANDYSLRATPSCVAFAGKKRVLGVAAKNQMVTNMKNTISGFKRLLGRKLNDPHIKNELNLLQCKIDQRTSDGGIGLKVHYLDEDRVFSPEQITAMLLTKLKETSTIALQAQVNDCVITCPIYFTNAERRALLDAANIAGLNVLRLMNETTATALSYGFYKQDLPDDNNKPRNVIFVDCGHASLQVSACAFTKGKLKMIASSWDQIGGRDFDYVLADYFSKEFQERYKINPKTNARAYLRLLTEVEKLKKQMSANSTKLPLNIECFMDEIDVHSSMQRSTMEDLCSHLLQRVDHTLRKCLKDSNLTLDEIHSVEIVGGSTRVPAIKHLIEQTFNKLASTTLNQDESVSRGAALMCAIMSPAVRVREFSVTDIQNYAVKVSWDGDSSGSGHGEMEVFPVFHAAPFSRLLTLYRREPFNIQISYAQPIPYPDSIIGKWYIKDIRPNEKGESQEIKVKVRINHHGIVLISSASLVEKKELTENEQQQMSNDEQQQNNGDSQQQQNEPMDVPEAYSDNYDGSRCDNNNDDDDDVDDVNNVNDDGLKNNNPNSSPVYNSPTASSPGGQGWAQRVKGWFTSDQNSSSIKDKNKKKTTSKLIELTLEAKTHGYTHNELQKHYDEEAKMISYDEQEKARVDARNALEEYVYDMREKLQEDGPLAPYVNNGDRENLCNQLNDLENWLYEEGEDCDKDLYKQKLTILHSQTDPIKQRSLEYEQQPNAFDELGHAIQMARKAIDEYRGGSQRYDHLTETEILNITEAADKAQKWLDESRNKFVRSIRTSDPSIKLSDIRHEYHTLTTCVNSVLNRPKPKPQTPPTAGAGAGTGGGNQKQQQQNSGGDQQQQDGQNGEVNSNSPPTSAAGSGGGGKGHHHHHHHGNEKTTGGNQQQRPEDTMDVE